MIAMVYSQVYIVMIVITLMIVIDTHTAKIVTNICLNMVNISGQKKRGIKYEEKIQAYGKHFGVSKYSLV